MSRSKILVVIFMLPALGVLLALGTWQMQRLEWKEDLIAMTKQRSASAPITLAQAQAQWDKTADVDYTPISVSGIYKHDLELQYFNTHEGTSGWNVFTPLQMSDGRTILVNRGFVPDQERAREKRTGGLLTGQQTVVGLARNPVLEKPNSLIPDNRPDKREFYWKSYSGMAQIIATETGSKLVAFTLDAAKSDAYSGYPLGGTTRMDFPNSHLQYAITWYGLALALLGVGGVFLFSRREN